MDLSRLERIQKKAKEAIEEVKVLYDISDTDMIVLTDIVVEVICYGLTAKTTARLLRAAAHYVETSEELADEFARELGLKKE